MEPVFAWLPLRHRLSGKTHQARYRKGGALFGARRPRGERKTRAAVEAFIWYPNQYAKHLA